MERTRVAVLLVAGVGSRLRPLTDDRPKALMDVGGETILGRAMRLLAEHGVAHVVLATGYRQDAIARAVEGSAVRVTSCHNPDFAHTQNAVSLALCRAALPPGVGWFKLDGDVVFEPEVLARLDASPAPLAVAVDAGRPPDAEAMKVELGPDRRILRFGKSLGPSSAAAESIGIERIGPSGSERIWSALEGARAAGRHTLYYEDVYSELVAGGALHAEAVPVDDLPWTEVDTIDDLARARELVARRASTSSLTA